MGADADILCLIHIYTSLITISISIGIIEILNIIPQYNYETNLIVLIKNHLSMKNMVPSVIFNINSLRSGDAFLQLLRLVIDAFSQRLHSHSDAL